MRSTMMAAWVRWGFIAASSALLTTGCRGGGGGSSGVGGFFSALFGGGDSGVFSAFGGSGDGGSSGSGYIGGSGDGGSSGSGDSGSNLSNPGPLADLPPSLDEDASTLHHPEPASLALFGSGLAGMALMRRQKTHKKKSRRTPA